MLTEHPSFLEISTLCNVIATRMHLESWKWCFWAALMSPLCQDSSSLKCSPWLCITKTIYSIKHLPCSQQNISHNFGHFGGQLKTEYVDTHKFVIYTIKYYYRRPQRDQTWIKWINMDINRYMWLAVTIYLTQWVLQFCRSFSVVRGWASLAMILNLCIPIMHPNQGPIYRYFSF